MNRYDFCYIRNSFEKKKPQLLGITRNGKLYFFQLETFHRNQYISPAKHTPRCHTHKVFHIVMYNKNSPDTNMQINDEHVDVKSGSVVCLPPELPHIFQPVKSSALYDEITFSFVDVNGKPLSACDFSVLFELWSGRQYQSIDHVFTPSGTLYYALLQHYKEIGDTLRNNATDLLPALGVVTKMMFALMEHISGVEVDTDPRLLRAKAYIENNYLNKNLTLSGIARHAGMSSEHFCKRFKKEFGESPFMFRQKLRMNAANQLLAISELQITEIADRLGFSDIYAFSRAYKNYNGTSPARNR